MSSASAARDAIIATEQQILCALRTGKPRQQHRDDAAAEPDLGRAEEAVFGGERDIAGERELHRAAEAVAMHCSERDLGAIPEAHDDLESRCCSARRTASGSGLPSAPVSMSRSKPAEKACRRPRPRSTRTTSSASAASSARPSCVDHRLVDRVELVGPVERQQRDGAAALVADQDALRSSAATSGQPEPRRLRSACSS